MSAKKVPYKGLKPEIVSDIVWCAVVDAWTNGLSDHDAAFRASKHEDVRITEADIKGWIKENPDIGELREYLHADLVSESKLVIAKAIRSEDVKTAKWYLEKKAPDEFGSKAAIALKDAVIELSLADKEQALNAMMEKYENEQ